VNSRQKGLTVTITWRLLALLALGAVAMGFVSAALTSHGQDRVKVVVVCKPAGSICPVTRSKP
jgi:hypothetical protein